jgi:hypothetical protein
MYLKMLNRVQVVIKKDNFGEWVQNTEHGLDTIRECREILWSEDGFLV